MSIFHPHTAPGLARRVVLRAGTVLPVGLGIGALAACGTDPDSGDSPAQTPPSPESSGADEPPEQQQDSGAGEGGAAVSTADVPVGQSYFDEDSNTVFAQPTEGEFLAFDATCPHKGCSVSDAADGELVCPCHGSRFDSASGDVLSGPSTTGLASKEVTVDGDGLVVG